MALYAVAQKMPHQIKCSSTTDGSCFTEIWGFTSKYFPT